MKKTKPTVNKVAFMVLVQGRGEPRHVHTSLAQANEEAKRLAGCEPNKLIRVLRIVSQMRGEVTPVDVPLDFPRPEDDPNHIPF